MMNKGTCSTPAPARNPKKGGHERAYEAPVRTSGTPRRTSSAGKATMMNVSEVKPGAGTGGDGTKVRSVR